MKKSSMASSYENRNEKSKSQFDQINYLMIEPNSHCNLRCLSCTREDLVKAGYRKPKSIEQKDFRFILDQLKNCPLDTIKLEGMSEPFLHPDLLNLVEITKEYFPKAHLILISNLQYKIQNTEVLKILNQTDAFYISIDGTGGIYESLRPPAKWDLMLRNLEWLSQQSTVKQKSKIFLNFTASQKNYTEIPMVEDLRKKFGFQELRINLIQDWREQSFNQNEFPMQMIEFLKDYKVNLKGVTPWSYQDCFWPFNGVVIDVEGNVRQCVLNTTQIPLGNVFENSLQEIYDQNPTLNRVRSALNQNKCEASCTTCDYANISPVLSQIFEGPSAAKAKQKCRVE